MVLLMGLLGVFPTTRGANGQGAEEVTGFTFSERQSAYLGLPWRSTFEAAMDLSPKLLRLGAYWDTIETRPGQYDFSTLDWLVDHTPAHTSVILTVGMKAPRWPEYYLPGWLENDIAIPDNADVSANPEVRAATLRFIEQVVRRYQNRGNIAYWQVENEPFTPAGPHHWRIDASFLGQEVALVRSLDRRPIAASMFVDTSPWAALPPWRGWTQRDARTLSGMVDVLGLDVYPVEPYQSKTIHLSIKWPAWVWERGLLDLRNIARAAGKQVWISEAQAEPWIPARLIDDDPRPAPLALPTSAAQAFSRLKSDGFHTILFWGVEYWYMRLERYRDSGWWSSVKPFFSGTVPPTG